MLPTAGSATPLVPLWTVCARRRWAESVKRNAFELPARFGAGIPIALHGDVGALALAGWGACRDDLLAIAIDPRAFPDAGLTRCVRVGLDAAGRAVMRLNVACLPITFDDANGRIAGGLVHAVEALVPLPDQAGYREPSWQTAGDVERRSDRDGLRRTS